MEISSCLILNCVIDKTAEVLIISFKYVINHRESLGKSADRQTSGGDRANHKTDRRGANQTCNTLCQS